MARARRPRHGLPGGRAVRLADRARERRLQAVRRDRHAARRRSTQRVEEVLGFVGLAEYIDRMPSELSGGQRRRVAIARAMASKPRILLYDEPTTGLDPITATTVDDEIIKLRDLESVSSIVVTHQLRDAFYVATHTAVRDGRRQSGSCRPTTGRSARPSSSCCATGSSSSRATPRRCGDSSDRVLAERFCRRATLELETQDDASHTIARLVGTEDRRADDCRGRDRRCTIFLLTGGRGFFWQRYNLKTGSPTSRA